MTTIAETSAATFAAQRPKARELYIAARQLLAGGVGHDLRHNAVAPTYIDHALGSRKWDVDGNEYVDYGMGNAALLVGHAHPEVLEAVRAVIGRGLHFGNDHPDMIEWAQLIHDLVPSAEKIRFTSSGSEAAMLALRLARAYTGREQVLRLEGHFSGWHDAVGRGAAAPFDAPVSMGIPRDTVKLVVVVPADLERVEAELRDNHDIAALMIEPSGGSWGTVPLTLEFNRELRALTRQYGVPLIYDEVITGFRYSPGGYQGLAGITPDLSVFGKVITGGLPGAAVVGRAEIMGLFDYTGDAQHDRYQRVSHLGTFNANPLSTAAGIATLKLVADGRVQAHADRMAELLRSGMERALENLGAAAYVYGDSSLFHVYMEEHPGSGATSRQALRTLDAARLKSIPGRVVAAYQRNLQIRGMDLLSYTGGVTSSAHTEADIEQSIAAFDETMQTLLREEIVARVGKGNW
jgi:glutamate-1-semialdehyde 2,1-aminomutase